MTTPRTSNKIDDSNPGSSRHLGRADHLSKSKNMGASSTNPFYYLCSCPTLPLHDSSHSDSSIDGLRITQAMTGTTPANLSATQDRSTSSCSCSTWPKTIVVSIRTASHPPDSSTPAAETM
ncbi:unnamed protein product [Musa acuminata var. zebrina]